MCCLALAFVAAVACGDDNEQTGTPEGSEDEAGTVEAVHSCLQETGFRLVDEEEGLEEPRFDAEAEFQVDTGVEDAPGFIGVFLYASEDEAAAGEEKLAGASTIEVVGRAVLAGSLQEAGEEFASAADEVRDCASGG